MSLKFEQKRIEILKAAQKRFVRHGLFKTSIEEIARDMRMSKSSLYHYYKSKEEIYYRCVEMEMADFLGESITILNNEASGPAEKLSQFLHSKSVMPKHYKLLYHLFIAVLSDLSTQFEDDLLLKFMQEETNMFRNVLNNVLPNLPEAELEKIIKVYPLISSSLPLVTGMQEGINQKVDLFSEIPHAADTLIAQWIKALPIS